jgi:hypothetical protein
MFGAAPIQDEHPGPVDPATMVTYMRALVAGSESATAGGGLALLLCHPGTTDPWDLRTAAQRAESDELRAAQGLDEDAPARVDEMSTSTAVSLSAWLRSALKKSGVAANLKCGPVDGVPNLACDVAASRVIVLHAADDEGLAVMKNWLAERSGDPKWRDPAAHPTVTGPDGYSVWFALPGDGSSASDPSISVGAVPAVMRIAGESGGFTVKLHSTAGMVPGSQTDTGVWRVTGEAADAPEWLLAWISGEATRLLTAVGDRVSCAARYGEQAAVWASSTSWEDILAAAGFSPTAEDVCGCDVLTTASGVTVTAHRAGCGVEPSNTPADAGARFWTTGALPGAVGELMERLGRDTLTPVELAAGLYFAGDVDAAVSAVQTSPADLTGGVRGAADRAWGPAGVVTVVADASGLGTCDVVTVHGGPGTDNPLTADPATWTALATAAEHADLVVVDDFPGLVAGIDGDPGAVTAWARGNLDALASGLGIAVTVVDPRATGRG